MKDYRCQSCGGSFSLPLGMRCSDHNPVAICSTCDGQGVVFCADDDDIGDACDACGGTGRDTHNS